MLAVHFHCLHGDFKLARDLFAGTPAEHQPAHLQLTPGQRRLHLLDPVLHAALPVRRGLGGLFQQLPLERHPLAHQRSHPRPQQFQQGDLFDAEPALATQRQAQRALRIQLHVVLNFIGNHVKPEIALVVVRLLETLRGHIRQAHQAGHRSLSAGHVERVQQVQAVQVVLEQRVRVAVCTGAFGKHLRAPCGEQQRHPAVAGNVLVQQPHQGCPEVVLVEGFDQLAYRSVPGDVVQRKIHPLPLLGYHVGVIPPAMMTTP
ncbi:hypothetical protein D3C75_839650 [compost metagenome]